MPIIFKSTHICEKCNHEFEWIYFEFIRQPLSSNLFVEKIPNGLKAHHIEKINDKTYKVAVNCPKCDYDNFFEYVLED